MLSNLFTRESRQSVLTRVNYTGYLVIAARIVWWE